VVGTARYKLKKLGGALFSAYYLRLDGGHVECYDRGMIEQA
jgi:hypothetical protein